MGLGTAIITGPLVEAHQVAKTIRIWETPVRGDAGKFTIDVDCLCSIPNTHLCAGCGAEVFIHVLGETDKRDGWKAVAWGHYDGKPELTVERDEAVPIVIDREVGIRY